MTLRILGVGPGDEVIVPSYTYTASVSPVVHVGATPVMIDCKKGKFTWDYDLLEKAITDKTKVILAVDLFGIPADYDRIYEILERKKHLYHPSDNSYQQLFDRCIVLSDSAHSLGAKYKEQPATLFPDFAYYSFHAVKNLTTAEGGAVTWRNNPLIDDDELYKTYQLYSLHGQTKTAFAKTQSGAWEYDVVAPLYKCNMTDIHAAIGLAQIRRYDDILKRREEIVSRYNEAFKDLPVKLLDHYTDQYHSSSHLYVVRLFHENGIPFTHEERNRFISLLAEKGVSANVHYKPLPMLTAYKNLGYNIEDYPNAYTQFVNAVTLPLHTCLSDEDVNQVISAFRDSLLEINGQDVLERC